MRCRCCSCHPPACMPCRLFKRAHSCRPGAAGTTALPGTRCRTTRRRGRRARGSALTPARIGAAMSPAAMVGRAGHKQGGAWSGGPLPGPCPLPRLHLQVYICPASCFETPLPFHRTGRLVCGGREWQLPPPCMEPAACIATLCSALPSTGYKIWLLPPPATTVFWMSWVQGEYYQQVRDLCCWGLWGAARCRQLGR